MEGVVLYIFIISVLVDNYRRQETGTGAALGQFIGQSLLITFKSKSWFGVPGEKLIDTGTEPVPLTQCDKGECNKFQKIHPMFTFLQHGLPGIRIVLLQKVIGKAALDFFSGKLDPFLIRVGWNVDSDIEIQLAGLQKLLQIRTFSIDKLDGDVGMGWMVKLPDQGEEYITAQAGDADL